LTNPGACTLSVLPMPAAAARQVSFPPLSNGYQPPPPTHCVLNSGRTVPGSTTRLYLPVPPHYPDEVRARLWAAQNGYHTMAPPIACPISVIQQVRAAAAQPPPPAASPTPQP